MESHLGCADCAVVKRNYKRNPELRMVVVYNGNAPCESKLKPKHSVQATLAMHKEDHKPKMLYRGQAFPVTLEGRRQVSIWPRSAF